MTEIEEVKDFWNQAACGETLLLSSRSIEGFKARADERYRLEPYIIPFADFANTNELNVLEVGLGPGADHERFAKAGATLYGIDITPRAVSIAKQRLEMQRLVSDVRVGDAEALPYANGTFDLVYSLGVIHHSPDTLKAAQEILRVLKPGGRFRVMVYHTRSLVGAMLWLRYGLARGRPFTPLAQIYSKYLESPGTKAYSCDEAARFFANASNVVTQVLSLPMAIYSIREQANGTRAGF